MATRVILECANDKNSEDINVKVDNTFVCIYNNNTDATAWYVNICFEDWNDIKSWVDQQIKSIKND